MKKLARQDDIAISLADGSTVTIDPAKGHSFILSGSTARTLAVGTAGYDGQRIIIRWKNTAGSAITHILDIGATDKFRYLGSANALNPTAAGASDYLIAEYHDTDDRWDVLGQASAELPGAVLPAGHIFGLTLSNAADTANDITIAAGKARDEADTDDLILTSAITKQLDVAWAVGTAAGGINTGAEANSTWYEVILIKRPDTGVVDVMFSTTANRATLPANYTKYRRIGWIHNDGAGAIRQFTQVGDYFTLTTQVNDVSVTFTTTATAATLTAPPNTIVRFRASATSNTSVNGPLDVVFSEIVEGNVTPANTTGISSLTLNDIAGGSAGHFNLRVSSSSQIEYDCDAATGSPTFDISTYGWIDHRCRLAN